MVQEIATWENPSSIVFSNEEFQACLRCNLPLTKSIIKIHFKKGTKRKLINLNQSFQNDMHPRLICIERIVIFIVLGSFPYSFTWEKKLYLFFRWHVFFFCGILWSVLFVGKWMTNSIFTIIDDDIHRFYKTLLLNDWIGITMQVMMMIINFFFAHLQYCRW